ncbi:ribosome biogenesis GTP-binding protein YihA/YsxC [Helicobacter marmotae]|uniref:Probable GTP-binding protein EngB n=1 Tax=Helicobacter marmotae TaxID=152490 RepID=A0A3D8I709_9HELI|nr:ribosome biogenesis GTP-binding protein YihA/YsxC [Helicobacter marmotae]RDU60321.1 YihA family ribosome biogenesis GTP-binding protein [Helicobacter marmotae]
MIQVLESAFVKSASHIGNAPAPSASEIVCLGRSNVGKSTFINAILNKNLAKSSATPGKTRLMNFFYSLWAMDKERIPLMFIDLPGFGYAKVSKATKEEWGKVLLDFLHKRQSIKVFLHLIDSRHPDMEIDKTMNAMLKDICANDQAILNLYTKADKLTQSALNALKAHIQKTHTQKTHTQQTNALNENKTSFICSAIKNHHKFTSIPQIREEIISFALGLKR